MTKITLENCASKYEGRKILAPQDWPRAAALIRAAQKVVEAADEVWLPGAGYRECGCELKGRDELDSALAAFRKLEEGE